MHTVILFITPERENIIPDVKKKNQKIVALTVLFVEMAMKWMNLMCVLNKNF